MVRKDWFRLVSVAHSLMAAASKGASFRTAHDERCGKLIFSWMLIFQ